MLKNNVTNQYCPLVPSVAIVKAVQVRDAVNNVMLL